MEEQQGFQTKFNEPLPNPVVEDLATTLCLHSGIFIRDLNKWNEVPLTVQHQFREYACELADIVGVDGFSKDSELTKLRVAAMHFINKVESGRAYSFETYKQLKEAMGIEHG